MNYDPNFPVDLAIFPSTPTSLSEHTESNQSAFSSSAQLASIKKYGIAGRVWEASYPLLLYLTHEHWVFDPPFTVKSDQNLTILELGAGTGIVTSKLLESVANGEHDIVISTDLPEVCPLLAANVNGRSNDAVPPCHAARVRPLAWGSEVHAAQIAAELGLALDAVPEPGRPSETRYLTHIVCSDLVYFPELLAPLLRTLIHLSSYPFISPEAQASGVENAPQIIISYKIRSLSKETAFWSAFGLWFTFEPVIMRPNTSPNGQIQHIWRRLGVSSDSFVFVAKRRRDSLHWTAPANDSDLLAGVGAWDTGSRKCDDTFETLLLMGLGEEDNLDDEM